MGFALPLLSLTRFAFQARRTANAMRENAAPKTTLSEEPQTQPAVFTMRRSRSRRRAAAASSHAAAQMALPQQAEPACSQPRILRIVQREPRKQPECLMISGRMADVCAALERMAANESALHA
jgi:hypothetical protein